MWDWDNMNVHTSLPMKAKLAGLILGFSALVLFLTAQLFSIWYKALLFFSSFINCFREQKQGQSEYMSWLKANQRSLSKAEVRDGCMPLYSEDNSWRKRILRNMSQELEVELHGVWTGTLGCDWMCFNTFS